MKLETIQQLIYVIRGQEVMLDSDLADLYGVETKMLNRAVKRHTNRFPSDFMFQLTQEEFKFLKSNQGNSTWGGRRFPPYAFTEEGVAMLSSVLNSSTAIEVNIQIMRAFVQIRKTITSHQELWRKITEMEAKYDQKFQTVFEAIRLMLDIKTDKRKIGFEIPEAKD